MTEIRIQKFKFIRLIYGILIIIILVSAFLPYYAEHHAPYPPPPATPVWDGYTREYMGYIALIFGGWVGVALAIVSIILMNPERKKKALLFGGLSFLLIILSLMIYPSIISLNQAIVNPITFMSGFYLCLIFGIGLIGTNVIAVVSKEGEMTFQRFKSTKIKEEKVKTVKRKALEIEPIEIKQRVVVGTDWEDKQLAEQKAIDFIITMQFQSRELPFFEIISKTGIKRKALETIVDDMITNKAINARVRDFVIIFKEISKEKREEGLKKVKMGLERRFSDIDELIQGNRFDEAIAILKDVIESANEFGLTDIKTRATKKIEQINKIIIEKKGELEEERIEDKEQIKTRKKLQKRLSSIEKLIESNKFYDAIVDLVEMKEIAKQYELIGLLDKIEEKIEYCKNFQFNTKKKVKNTILNYGSKLARLELMDISEKSGIQDETLIEKVILEMIKNHELNAEYFSSSKSIAFYQQKEEIKPLSEREEIEKQRVFLSYSTLDAEYFRISDIVKKLEVYPEIQKVSYWQADSDQNIVEFMENTLKKTDVFILFCSENSVNSDAVKGEWQAAYQMRKKGMLKIIPVYEIEDEIPVLLWQMLNVKYTKDDFEGFIKKLYEEILRGLQKQVSPTI